MYGSNQTLRTNKLKTTIDKIICKGYIIKENQNQRFGFETIGNKTNNPKKSRPNKDNKLNPLHHIILSMIIFPQKDNTAPKINV